MSPQRLACLVWVTAFLCGAAVPASAVLIGHVMHVRGDTGAHAAERLASRIAP
jgi:hypothetical protein